jgi:hypothetical protein
LWASAPPGTVRAYEAVISAYPSYAPDPNPQFWALMTPALGGFSVALFLTTAMGRAPSRFLVLTSSGMILTLVLSDYLFFNPTLIALEDPELPYEETSRLVQLWVSLNWVRIAVFLAAWFIALKALSLEESEIIR